MIPAERIFVICSLHQNFPKLLEVVRKGYPDAHITGIVPRGHLIIENERKHADDLLVATIPSFSVLHALGLLRLCGQLRAQQMDLFVTQFESIKLRTMIALSKPKAACAWLGGGQILTLSTSLTQTLTDLALHRVRGYGTTLSVFLQCYLCPLKTALPEAKRVPHQEPRERK